MFRLIIVRIYTRNMLRNITKLLYYQNLFIFLYILERVTISFFYMVYEIKFGPTGRRKPSCFSAAQCSVSHENRGREGGGGLITPQRYVMIFKSFRLRDIIFRGNLFSYGHVLFSKDQINFRQCLCGFSTVSYITAIVR